MSVSELGICHYRTDQIKANKTGFPEKINLNQTLTSQHLLRLRIGIYLVLGTVLSALHVFTYSIITTLCEIFHRVGN